jgi:hypothetical protein
VKGCREWRGLKAGLREIPSWTASWMKRPNELEIRMTMLLVRQMDSGRRMAIAGSADRAIQRVISWQLVKLEAEECTNPTQGDVRHALMESRASGLCLVKPLLSYTGLHHDFSLALTILWHHHPCCLAAGDIPTECLCRRLRDHVAPLKPVIIISIRCD